jgi:hypothetical protein
MPLQTVLSGMHSSALCAIAVVRDAVNTMVAEGWVGATDDRFPSMWPFVGDACGVAWRHGAGRMTWDKSGPRGIPQTVPFNLSLPMHLLPDISYTSVLVLALAAAILATCGLELEVWAFDLKAAYRRYGRQRTCCRLEARGLLCEQPTRLEAAVRRGRRLQLL